MIFRKGVFCFILLLGLIIQACSVSDENTTENADKSGYEDNAKVLCSDVVPTPYALWSEFLTIDEVIANIPVLLKNRLALFQAIPSHKIGDIEYAKLFREASCRGVETRAWLTLPKHQGYWPNEKNADVFSEKALELARWIRASGWNINWIIVDMEPDYEMMTTLLDCLSNGDYIEAVKILKENHNPERFEASRKAYSELVDDLHSLGFKVMAVSFPMVVDDMFDGDSSIQNLLNIPVSGINWDIISFMAYSTLFEKILGSTLNEYVVYAYSKDAVRFFHNKAAIDIGSIGSGGIFDIGGITKIEDFEAQIGVAKLAGVAEIHAFSIDGILTLNDKMDFFAAFDSEYEGNVKTQVKMALLRSAIRVLDKMID